MTPRSVPRDDLIGVIIAAALLSFLAFRITQAADLTDESYYAVFIDDWLKEGIRASPFRVVHQTAALLIYPAALVFRLAMGSTDGLIVFLRSLYVIGAALAALSTAALFWRLGTRLGGWLAGAIVLAFIPYGLPAPSYNTIGEQAMIIALASFGCAILAEGSLLLPAISALAWAFATVAYPPLFLTACHLPRIPADRFTSPPATAIRLHWLGSGIPTRGVGMRAWRPHLAADARKHCLSIRPFADVERGRENFDNCEELHAKSVLSDACLHSNRAWPHQGPLASINLRDQCCSADRALTLSSGNPICSLARRYFAWRPHRVGHAGLAIHRCQSATTLARDPFRRFIDRGPRQCGNRHIRL